MVLTFNFIISSQQAFSFFGSICKLYHRIVSKPLVDWDERFNSIAESGATAIISSDWLKFNLNYFETGEFNYTFENTHQFSPPDQRPTSTKHYDRLLIFKTKGGETIVKRLSSGERASTAVVNVEVTEYFVLSLSTEANDSSSYRRENIIESPAAKYAERSVEFVNEPRNSLDSEETLNAFALVSPEGKVFVYYYPGERRLSSGF